MTPRSRRLWRARLRLAALAPLVLAILAWVQIEALRQRRRAYS